ncbi:MULTISPECIES: glycogen synthase GlgA [unclassified Thioalkalivibrio]|uniref:glycogen synthase GlgA n=1 Tax=unclassified Thioalkalivibrio TaxID=2621013 RepID=UPI00036676B6|nr:MULTISPECIES: glycogen synthase GlgA [unclassified Thioalkalivibrio]
MRILFATSEVYGLVKTGGLADVSASLPVALRRRRQDARLILPAYPEAVQRLRRPVTHPGPEDAPWQLIEGHLPGTRMPVYLVDWPEYFQRAGNPYTASNDQDWPDNAQRFAGFARAVARVAADDAGLNWTPEIVHGNDWQCGLLPIYLREACGTRDAPASVFTIHNLAYQGLFPAETATALGLPAELWHPDGVEFHQQLSFMKAGLMFSDAITTVSPTYAREIQQPEHGMGLDGVLRARANVFHGILNGVDYRAWDPAHDPHIAAAYGPDDLSGKATCKAALQRRLGLAEDPDIPLLGHVGRMVEQKGMDLLLAVAAPLAEAGRIQLALVGSGQTDLEHAAGALSRAHPGRVGVHIGYDEPLAHQIEAGADLFAMPSRFEPCGLNQLYSLRYGTPPVVHATGGLADTVVDATPEALEDDRATGFTFTPDSIPALGDALERALALYHARADGRWEQLMRTGMQQNFDWQVAAGAYLELYRAHRPRARAGASAL